MVKERLDLGIETGINIDKIVAVSRSSAGRWKIFLTNALQAKCIVCLNATISN
jgi:hypothetical protein